MAVAIEGMPVTLEAEPGNYVLVRIDARVSNTRELEQLGADLARQHGIARPRIEVLTLRPRGNRYLIAVTSRDN